MRAPIPASEPRPGRSPGPENLRIVLLVALTFVTGATDAVSYLGLDRVFTANMTGNVALLGFAATGANGLSVLGSVSALFAFVAGAVLGGRITRRADLRLVWPRQMSIALGVSIVLLLAVLVWWSGTRSAPQKELVAVGMALAMGLQGAAARRLGVADLPTTVVTSTLTGLAADSFLAGGSGIRWRRRLASVVALIAGAVTGGGLVQLDPALGLIPAVVVLIGVVAVGTGAAARHQAGLGRQMEPAAVG